MRRLMLSMIALVAAFSCAGSSFAAEPTTLIGTRWTMPDHTIEFAKDNVFIWIYKGGKEVRGTYEIAGKKVTTRVKSGKNIDVEEAIIESLDDQKLVLKFLMGKFEYTRVKK